MKSVVAHRPDTAAAHQAAVERIVRHMKANLIEWDADLSLKALAKQACYSVPQLIETFQEITGTTPALFLASLRIQKAKELLLSTNKSVIEVALEVGYESPQSFSKKFADFVGMPPIEFRKAPQTMTPAQLAAAASDFVTRNNARAADSGTGNTLQGSVVIPESGFGVVFVGIFTRGVPQGRPFSGTVLFQYNAFNLLRPQEGDFHLLAALVSHVHSESSSPNTLCPLLVAQTFIKSGSSGTFAMKLRPIRQTDPPLVVSPVALLRSPDRSESEF